MRVAAPTAAQIAGAKTALKMLAENAAMLAENAQGLRCAGVTVSARCKRESSRSVLMEDPDRLLETKPRARKSTHDTVHG